MKNSSKPNERTDAVTTQEFTEIAEQYTDIVFRAVLSVCKNKADAEDAVQNAFLKLLKSNTRFNDSKHIRCWLIRSALNECKNMWKSYFRRNVISFEDLDFEPQYTDENNRALFEEVMKLPPKLSAVVHLYYYEGYNCSEMADILEISESAVQTRLQRARQKLKEQLREEWFDEKIC